MAQGYFTLDEAAQKLGLSPDVLKGMARKGEIRAFQDRGTWRFRAQEIEELSRQRGRNSEPELVLGESLKPTPAADAGPKSPAPKSREPEVFDFSLDTDEAVAIGGDPLRSLDQPGGKKPKTDSKLGPRTPPPTPGSDSDVKLVPDGSGIDFNLPTSGSAKLEAPESPPPRKKTSGLRSHFAAGEQPKKSSKVELKRRTGLPSDQPPPVDSGVRLVPMEGDSDVRLSDQGTDEIPLGHQPPGSATDSDVRLERASGPSLPGDNSPITEEIDLGDLGLEMAHAKKSPKDKTPRKTPPPVVSPSSPFELTEPDIKLPGDSSGQGEDSSSDFILTPEGSSSSPLEDGSDSSVDFTLEVADESEPAELDDQSAPEEDADQGLNQPDDGGISLEKRGSGSSGEIEFDLTLDGGAGLRPVSGKSPVDDSDSEFELTLDAEGELGGSTEVGSDSEFELTLDDSGGLAAMDASSPVEKDIFETDFEVPALDDDSGSMAVALDDGDTNLESSDFELAVDEEMAGAEESGSEVLALDEDELGAGKTRSGVAALDDEDFGDIAEDDLAPEELEAVGGRTVVQEKLVRNAPWGVLPVAVMLPCVVILFLVGMMGYELVQSQNGYQPPGALISTIGEMLGQKIKK